MASPRSKPDLWPLRDADRLPPEIIAREPLLADIENNPVFRLIAFERRRRGWRFGLDSATSGWTMLFLVFACCFFSLPGLLVAYAIVKFLQMRRSFDEHMAGSLALPSGRVEDLSAAGLSPSDFVMGIWAAELTKRRIQRVRIVLVFFGLVPSVIFLVGLRWSLFDRPGEWGWIICVSTMLLFLGFAGFASRYAFLPHGALPEVLKRLRALEHVLEPPAMQLSRVVGQTLFAIGLLLAVFVVPIMVAASWLPMPAILSSIWKDIRSLYAWLIAILGPNLFFVLLMVGVLMLSSVLALGRCRWVRRRSSRFLSGSGKSVSVILRFTPALREGRVRIIS